MLWFKKTDQKEHDALVKKCQELADKVTDLENKSKNLSLQLCTSTSKFKKIEDKLTLIEQTLSDLADKKTIEEISSRLDALAHIFDNAKKKVLSELVTIDDADESKSTSPTKVKCTNCQGRGRKLNTMLGQFEVCKICDAG